MHTHKIIPEIYLNYQKNIYCIHNHSFPSLSIRVVQNGIDEAMCVR